MKNSTGVDRLLRQGESETLEFKESFDKEALQSLCAFANTRGGVLLIGVDDRGQVRGVQGGRAALRQWANEIAQATGLHPSLSLVQGKDQAIVSIDVQESRFKPVLYHGKAYKRVGSTTRQMGPEELARVALESHGLSWDEVPEPRAKLADIAPAKLRAFVELANKEGRRRIPVGTQPEETLRKLGLMRDGKLARAAVLLFGKHPQKFYLQALVKAGRFRDETLIVDDRQIEGTLFDQVEGAMGYFRERLETRFEMTGRPARDVIWEFPLEALREAITNAVCHRDYLSSAHTQVRIYDRELMIWNPGGLPEGLSVEALKRKHESQPRNKLIAQIFYFAGLIEQWGGGTEKIVKECVAAGLPEPVFEEEMGLRVTFKKAAPLPGAPDKHPTSTRQVPTSIEPSASHRLLAYCSKPRTVKEMLAFMGLRDRESFLEKHLRPLLKQGLLTMTAPESPRSPKQRYILTDKGRAWEG